MKLFLCIYLFCGLLFIRWVNKAIYNSYDNGMEEFIEKDICKEVNLTNVTKKQIKRYEIVIYFILVILWPISLYNIFHK